MRVKWVTAIGCWYIGDDIQAFSIDDIYASPLHGGIWRVEIVRHIEFVFLSKAKPGDDAKLNGSFDLICLRVDDGYGGVLIVRDKKLLVFRIYRQVL
jgi:hypothetical protein